MERRQAYRTRPMGCLARRGWLGGRLRVKVSEEIIANTESAGRGA